jgi:uncharacterized membrane protein YjjP (DUF1212 family)
MVKQFKVVKNIRGGAQIAGLPLKSFFLFAGSICCALFLLLSKLTWTNALTSSLIILISYLILSFLNSKRIKSLLGDRFPNQITNL